MTQDPEWAAALEAHPEIVITRPDLRFQVRRALSGRQPWCVVIMPAGSRPRLLMHLQRGEAAHLAAGAAMAVGADLSLEEIARALEAWRRRV